MQALCNIDDIIPETGVCALVDNKQIAIFRTKQDQLFAIDNFDPFSQANVLSRGLLGGTRVNDKDIIYVASPIYKQRFNLANGECLDNADISVNSYQVEVNEGAIRVKL